MSSWVQVSRDSSVLLSSYSDCHPTFPLTESKLLKLQILHILIPLTAKYLLNHKALILFLLSPWLTFIHLKICNKLICFQPNSNYCSDTKPPLCVCVYLIYIYFHVICPHTMNSQKCKVVTRPTVGLTSYVNPSEKFPGSCEQTCAISTKSIAMSIC